MSRIFYYILFIKVEIYIILLKIIDYIILKIMYLDFIIIYLSLWFSYRFSPLFSII